MNVTHHFGIELLGTKRERLMLRNGLVNVRTSCMQSQMKSICYERLFDKLLKILDCSIDVSNIPQNSYDDRSTKDKKVGKIILVLLVYEMLIQSNWNKLVQISICVIYLIDLSGNRDNRLRKAPERIIQTICFSYLIFIISYFFNFLCL